MTDFFEEVEEQVRSDRYRELARKYLPWMLGVAAAALLATLAYWGWDYYQRQTMSKASEQYAAAIQAIQAGDQAKAKQLWTDVTKSQAKGYKALSLMHLGAFALENNNTAEAVKLFDQAAEAAPDPIIGDVARLKSAFAVMDTAPFKEVEGRLSPLIKEGRPYRLQAREALAFAKLNAGDLAGARGDFTVIKNDLDASEGLQTRAGAAIALIESGSAKAIPGVVKSAVAMPPPMVIAPGASVGGPPQGVPMPQAQPGAPQ